MTWEEKCLDVKQDFIRVLLNRYERDDNMTCSNVNFNRHPLLLFYNDMIDLEYQYILNTMSNCYGVGYISYHDTVIDFALPSSHETWFCTTT